MKYIDILRDKIQSELTKVCKVDGHVWKSSNQDELTHIIFSRKRNKMSTLWRKKVDLWTHFTFNIKDNLMLCKPCGATFMGKNTTNFYILLFH